MSKRMNLFLAFSARLTGVSQLGLLAAGVGVEYLQTLDTIVSPQRVDQMLEKFSKVPVGPDGDKVLAEEMLQDPQWGPLAKNLIVMWYCGTWEKLPDAWCRAYGVSSKDEPHVISEAAYLAGLQWSLVGAHPPGGAPPGFGSWAEQPVRSGL